MKATVIWLLLIFFSVIVNAQDSIDYTEADRVAMDIPIAKTNTTAAIAEYINSHLNADDKKVRAAYIWVASNIRYSTDSIHRVILMEDHDQLVTYSLRRKKGVCENFAAIFNDICKKCGLHSFVIEGYTRQNGFLDKTAHAWCTVFIDKSWRLYDPTWDAGTIKSYEIPVNTTYYEASPEIFIESHMPFDPMFQLLNYPLSFEEFNKGNTSLKNNKPYFNFTDSLNVYENFNPINEYASSAERIKNNGSLNRMTNTKISQLKMEMEIINQDRDSVLYSGAVTDYNTAIKKFNGLIAYRNNQFKPEKTDAEVENIFNEIEQNISSARTKIAEANKSKALLTLDTGDIKYALDNLSTHVKEQQAFLKNYLSTSKNK